MERVFDSSRLVLRAVDCTNGGTEYWDSVKFSSEDINGEETLWPATLVLHEIVNCSDGIRLYPVKIGKLRTTEGVLEAALWNTQKLFPARLVAERKMKAVYLGPAGDLFSPNFKINRDEARLRCGLRLTTSIWYGGAIAFYYPGVRERIGELLGGDFFAVPLNTHEVRIHPVGSVDPMLLWASLREYRKNENPLEWLAPQVGRCRRR